MHKDTDDEDLKKAILKAYEENKVVFMDTIGTCNCVKMDDFFSQNINGILYDLNRSEEVILSFTKEPTWVNDFAMCKCLRYLYEENQKLKKKLKNMKKETNNIETNNIKINPNKVIGYLHHKPSRTTVALFSEMNWFQKFCLKHFFGFFFTKEEENKNQ